MTEFPELQRAFAKPAASDIDAGLRSVGVRIRRPPRRRVRGTVTIIAIGLGLSAAYAAGFLTPHRRITVGSAPSTETGTGQVVVRAPTLLMATLPAPSRTVPGPGPEHSRFIEFHLWQIEPDGSRFSAGGIRGGGSDGYDIRMWITPDRRIAGNEDYRLDADFVVHWLGDTTALIGDVDAIREVSRSRTPGDSVTRARLEEESYRRSVALVPGSSAWFYPFGLPQRGERGIGFEITASDSMPAGKIPFERGHDFLLSGRGYGAEFAPRLHRARIRIEIGDSSSGWHQVFEGPALTRVPLRVSVRGGSPSGQDLLLELQDPEWRTRLDHHDTLCWHWYWADRKTRGGGSCTSINRGTSIQRLYGTGAGQLRVTILSAE